MIALGNVMQAFVVGGYEMLIGTVYDKAGSIFAWCIEIGTGFFVTVVYNLIRRKDRVYYKNLYH